MTSAYLGSCLLKEQSKLSVVCQHFIGEILAFQRESKNWGFWHEAEKVPHAESYFS